MVKLYVIPVSHPALAARLMLERVEIEHEVVTLPPGIHAVILRLLGFPGGTVPALRMDGRKVQGSLEISRTLDALDSARPLFPDDPDARRRVEEAERWGERELQPIPRRLFRWALNRDAGLRRKLAETSGIPLPGLAGRILKPIAARFARVSEAHDEAIRRDMARLPALLDRVDGWIAEGVIGGETPNAADYQIATTVRVLLAFEDLQRAIGDRPAAALATRFVPDHPGEIAHVLPEGWRPPRHEIT